jgi:hypothetical protein
LNQSSRQLALEASLRKDWSLETLEVYADLMQEVGHVWGELCALDLHATPGTAQRRVEILALWFGEELAERVSSLVRYGFVFELKSGALADAIFDSPLGDYVWAYEIVMPTGDGDSAAEELRRLARKPRLWLERLTVSSPFLMTTDYQCGVRLCDRLVKAIPNLKHLSLPTRFSFSGDIGVGAQACLKGEIDLSNYEFERVLELVSDCTWATLVSSQEHLAPDLGLSRLLLHLHNAKLLRLKGPLLESTNIGQSWLHPPSFHKLPVVDPGFVGGRYEVLIEPEEYHRASEGDGSGRFWFDRMVNHISFVMHGIEKFSFDEGTYMALRSYLALLCKVWDSEGTSFRLSRNMIDALETLWSVNQLAKYGLDIETHENEWELPTLLHFCEANWHRSLVIRLEWD